MGCVRKPETGEQTNKRTDTELCRPVFVSNILFIYKDILSARVLKARSIYVIALRKRTKLIVLFTGSVAFSSEIFQLKNVHFL